MSSLQTKSLKRRASPNTKSASARTGSPAPGTTPTCGTEESLTSLSPDRMPGSSIGRLEKFIPTMMIKNTFTQQQFSPDTVMCGVCGQSTFTLTLESGGKRPSIVMSCAACSNTGKLELNFLI